jgi:hypothetical protein
MTLRPTSHRQRRRRDVHKALDAYVEWREACLAVQVAYGLWRSRRGGDRAFAFYAYEDALDREEHAANVYARLVRAIGEATLTGRAVPLAEISGSPGA